MEKILKNTVYIEISRKNSAKNDIYPIQQNFRLLIFQNFSQFLRGVFLSCPDAAETSLFVIPAIHHSKQSCCSTRMPACSNHYNATGTIRYAGEVNPLAAKLLY